MSAGGEDDAATSGHVREAVFWGALGGLGAGLVVPYVAVFQPEIHEAPFPLWLVAVLAAGQNGVLLTLFSWLALQIGEALGLGSPLVREWFTAGAVPVFPWKRIAAAASIGVVGGLVVLGLDGLFGPHMPATREALAEPGPALGLLASVYGGVTEEVMLRLVLVTVLAWAVHGLAKVVTGHDERAPALAFAVLVAALLFAFGHLPLAGAIWPLTTVVVARTLLLNTLLGLAFGTLFVGWGLEMAVISHFCADLVLHVAAPLAERLLGV